MVKKDVVKLKLNICAQLISEQTEREDTFIIEQEQWISIYPWAATKRQRKNHILQNKLLRYWIVEKENSSLRNWERRTYPQSLKNEYPTISEEILSRRDHLSK